jgi:hypothetical protein
LDSKEIKVIDLAGDHVVNLANQKETNSMVALLLCTLSAAPACDKY